MIDRLPLPFRDACFDAVIYVSSLSGAANHEELLHEFKRILNRSGLVFARPNLLNVPGVAEEPFAILTREEMDMELVGAR